MLFLNEKIVVMSYLRVIRVVKVQREDVKVKKKIVLVTIEEDELVLIIVEEDETMEALDNM